VNTDPRSRTSPHDSQSSHDLAVVLEKQQDNCLLHTRGDSRDDPQGTHKAPAGGELSPVAGVSEGDGDHLSDSVVARTVMRLSTARLRISGIAVLGFSVSTWSGTVSAITRAHAREERRGASE
jgi:hypothetical protein